MVQRSAVQRAEYRLSRGTELDPAANGYGWNSRTTRMRGLSGEHCVSQPFRTRGSEGSVAVCRWWVIGYRAVQGYFRLDNRRPEAEPRWRWQKSPIQATLLVPVNIILGNSSLAVSGPLEEGP